MKNYLSILLSLTIFWIVEAKAHVELNYPEGGETLYSGETVNIKWTELVAHGTTHWELYYSPDAGETWITISDNIDYPLREYEWDVPFEETTLGRIKVIMNNPGTDYEDECPDYTIKNITGTGQNPSSNELFESFNIFPNPMRSKVNLSFRLDKPEYIAIEFYNFEGKKVDMIPGQNLLPGSYTIPWNKYGLKPGNYICIVKTADSGKPFKMTVLR